MGTQPTIFGRSQSRYRASKLRAPGRSTAIAAQASAYPGTPGRRPRTRRRFSEELGRRMIGIWRDRLTCPGKSWASGEARTVCTVGERFRADLEPMERQEKVAHPGSMWRRETRSTPGALGRSRLHTLNPGVPAKSGSWQQVLARLLICSRQVAGGAGPGMTSHWWRLRGRRNVP